jgi:hypothetical protein
MNSSLGWNVHPDLGWSLIKWEIEGAVVCVEEWDDTSR